MRKYLAVFQWSTASGDLGMANGPVTMTSLTMEQIRTAEDVLANRLNDRQPITSRVFPAHVTITNLIELEG